MAIADEVERRHITKRYYLETRADVLLRNREVFARWARLGLRYMFIGIEAIDEKGLKYHRKRVHLGENERALEEARKLGLIVAVNIIADPDWDERRFEIVREWGVGRAGDRSPDDKHPVPWYRKLGTRFAQLHQSGLSALRCAACGLTDATPPAEVLRGVCADAEHSQPQTPRVPGAVQHLRHFAPAACPRTDKLCPYAVEVQSGLQC